MSIYILHFPIPLSLISRLSRPSSFIPHLSTLNPQPSSFIPHPSQNVSAACMPMA